MEKTYDRIKIKKLKNSEAEIEGEVTSETLERHRKAVFLRAKESLTLPGFRKGQVPEDMAKKYIDENHLLEDAAESALSEAYPEIVEDNNLEIMTRPQVTITKLAAGNPLGFKIRVGITPEVSLPNYKKIAKKILDAQKPPEISEKEIDDTVEQILKMRRLTPAAGTADDKPVELTDEFVKTLGQFKDVADFREKISANLKLEKEGEEKRKFREEVADKLIEASDLVISEIAIEEEARAMSEKRHEEVKRAGMTPEDYLKRIGKTEEELAKEERGYIERQIKTRFLLEKIASTEHIKADDKRVEEETMYLAARFPASDPLGIRNYATKVLQNEAVLEFLGNRETQT